MSFIFSYPQYIASGASPQSGYHLQVGTADSRDPSGPDGSSSVGYMGVDIHGLTPGVGGPSGYSPRSPMSKFSPHRVDDDDDDDDHDDGEPIGADVEETAEEESGRRQLSRTSFSGLRRGQHPGKHPIASPSLYVLNFK